jgi:hypothetical protein
VGITLLKDEPSAQIPWTNTMLGLACVEIVRSFMGYDPRQRASFYKDYLLQRAVIPSLINLMIGSASFFRGVPGLPALLLRFMPAGKAVPPFDVSGSRWYSRLRFSSARFW